MAWHYRRGFGFDVGFTDHLYTQLQITSNYNAIANLHTLQITTTPTKPFPAYCIFTSRFLVTACNSGNSSASAMAAPYQRLIFSQILVHN
jgi:hypothetical protein